MIGAFLIIFILLIVVLMAISLTWLYVVQIFQSLTISLIFIRIGVVELHLLSKKNPPEQSVYTVHLKLLGNLVINILVVLLIGFVQMVKIIQMLCPSKFVILLNVCNLNIQTGIEKELLKNCIRLDLPMMRSIMLLSKVKPPIFIGGTPLVPISVGETTRFSRKFHLCYKSGR